MSATSQVSSTDLNLFKKLANQTVCDVAITLPAPTKRKQANVESNEAKASMKAAIQKAAESDEEDERGTAKKSKTLTEAMSEVKTDVKIDMKTEKVEARSEAKTEAKEDSDDSDNEAPKREEEKNDASKKQDSVEDRLEKQAYLIELQQIEKKGTKLSREFSMQDSLAELEFEVSKQNTGLSTQNTVAFMRDSMRMVISGIEIGNAKLGPFLSIDGWGNSLSSDMSRYDHSLERIYKRYFRKQQMSPILELGWLILGSMIMFHVKNKIFGVASNSSPAPGTSGTGGVSDLLGMFMGKNKEPETTAVPPLRNPSRNGSQKPRVLLKPPTGIFA